MKTRDCSCELNILVGGRPITEYEHNGAVFVEGRKGSDFELEYKNQTRHRVLVIPAVDGKSVLDGQTATPESKGYVVPAWGSVRIPGWTLDGSNVAKFTFEDKDKSYAAQMAEVTEAVQAGVIGVLVYQEKAPEPTIQHHHHYHTKTIQPAIQPYNPWSPGTPVQPWTTTPLGPWFGTSYSSQDVSATRATLNTTSIQANNALSASTASAPDSVASDSHENTSFDMGTAFGSKTGFNTREVKFLKGDMTAQLSIYYDSRRNLEKRGIQVARRETRYLTDLPSAFSGLGGCNPPPGWQG